VTEIGTVTSSGDGIVHVEGLEGCKYGELLEFEENAYGIVMNLSKENIGAVILNNAPDVSEGSTVRNTGTVVQVPVGDQLLGRVISPLGVPLDGSINAFGFINHLNRPSIPVVHIPNALIRTNDMPESAIVKLMSVAGARTPKSSTRLVQKIIIATVKIYAANNDPFLPSVDFANFSKNSTIISRMFCRPFGTVLNFFNMNKRITSANTMIISITTHVTTIVSLISSPNNDTLCGVTDISSLLIPTLVNKFSVNVFILSVRLFTSSRKDY